MLLRNSGDLRPVYHIEDFSAPEEGIDIVIVPGVWLDYPSDRYKNNCSWIKPLILSTNNDTRVFLFDYHLETDGSSLWNQLLSQSIALIESLEKVRMRPGAEQRPLLFICHSLGGLIVKRSLTLAFQSRKNYEDVTSGIIFLGTPHLTSPSAEGWDNVKLIMKANRKDISKQNMTDNEMESIVTTCRQFDNLRLTIPILSVYEGRETRVRESLLSAFRGKAKTSVLLVTEAMAQVNSPNESIFEIDKCHPELCDVEIDGQLYARLTKFFSAFAENAPTNVRMAFRPIPVNNLEHLDLRSQSSVSSFLETSSNDIQYSKTYTPGSNESPGNIVNSGALIQSEMGDNLIHDEREKAVQLPFSSIASISRNQKFFGRTDVLDEIDRAFGLNSPTDSYQVELSDAVHLSGPRSYALCGMGGIGKTEIAIEYLYSRRDQFDAVFWIYADTTRKLAAQYVALAKELGTEAVTDALDEVSARDIVRNWLSAPTGFRTTNGVSQKVDAKWLIIFDNADEPDIFYDWLPIQGPGCIIVTSRYPYVEENTHRLGVGLSLQPFSPRDGGEMLRRMADREKEVDAVLTSIRISETLGGLPLAISQISASIRRKHLSLRDLEDWYNEGSKDLHNMPISGPESTYKHNIWSTWATEQLSAPALTLLRVLSVLDPDRIPEDLLRDGAKRIELEHYPVNKIDYFNARAELINSSLVSRNMAMNELRIHRLVQEVVRHKMNSSELQAIYAATTTLISAVWPYVTHSTRNRVGRVPIAEKFTAHICRLEALFGSDIRKGEYSGTPESGFLFCSYAWYVSERGLPDQTEHFSHLAQIILEKALEDNQGDRERVTFWLAEVHHNLALTAVVTGSSDGLYDAKAWIEIVTDRIMTYNPPLEGLLLAGGYNQLGISYAFKSQMEDAIKSWHQSLATYKGVKDAPSFSGTWPAISLAYSYVLLSKPDEGEKVLKSTLEEHERLLGKDDMTTQESGHIWRAMGNIRNSQERFEEGLKYHKLSLENLKFTIGEKHYYTGDAFYSLGSDYWRQGDNDKARANLDAAIEIFGSERHTKGQSARALWKKGCLLKAEKLDLQSRALFKEAMKIRHELVPRDHRPVEDLKDEDWAKLLIYWSR